MNDAGARLFCEMDEEMKKGQQCGALLIFFSGSHVPSLMTGMNAIMTVSALFQYQFCLCFYSTLALYFSADIEYAVHGKQRTDREDQGGKHDGILNIEHRCENAAGRIRRLPDRQDLHYGQFLEIGRADSGLK